MLFIHYKPAARDSVLILALLLSRMSLFDIGIKSWHCVFHFPEAIDQLFD